MPDIDWRAVDRATEEAEKKAAAPSTGAGMVKGIQDAAKIARATLADVDFLDSSETKVSTEKLKTLCYVVRDLAALEPVAVEAELPTENEPASVTEVMQRCSDQCNRMEKRERATFSIKGIRMLLAEITELRRNLRHWREECGKVHAKLRAAESRLAELEQEAVKVVERERLRAAGIAVAARIVDKPECVQVAMIHAEHIAAAILEIDMGEIADKLRRPS